MNTLRWRTRSGFTVLEVGITITLSTLLVALAVSMFSAVLQAQRQTVRRDRLRREFMRLDSILRRDAHAASEVALNDPQVCELRDQLGNRWRYQANEQGLVREHRRDDELRQREVFHWPAGAVAEFTLAKGGSRQLLELTIAERSSQSDAWGREPGYRGRILVGGWQASNPREANP